MVLRIYIDAGQMRVSKVGKSALSTDKRDLIFREDFTSLTPGLRGSMAIDSNEFIQTSIPETGFVPIILKEPLLTYNNLVNISFNINNAKTTVIFENRGTSSATFRYFMFKTRQF